MDVTELKLRKQQSIFKSFATPLNPISFFRCFQNSDRCFDKILFYLEVQYEWYRKPGPKFVCNQGM